MIRIIIHGAAGYMGRAVSEICEADPEVTVVAGVDVTPVEGRSYPVYSSIGDVDKEADVVIDFSHVSAIDSLIEHCGQKRLPLVLCTTGLSEDQLNAFEALSKNIAVLRSANMSLGINALLSLLNKAAAIFAPAGYDMEIVEKHHNRKLDAPSGTALALADCVNAAAGGDYEYVYDRSIRREKRPQKEIGISAVRGGTIVGEHDVIFAGTDEVITFSHTAFSRSVFAKGAVEAAKFIAGREPGLYGMSDVVSKAILT